MPISPSTLPIALQLMKPNISTNRLVCSVGFYADLEMLEQMKTLGRSEFRSIRPMRLSRAHVDILFSLSRNRQDWQYVSQAALSSVTRESTDSRCDLIVKPENMWTVFSEENPHSFRWRGCFCLGISAYCLGSLLGCFCVFLRISADFP